MDEHDLMAASDDGTFVPFTDMLFNVVIGLAFMVFIAFSLINPTAKKIGRASCRERVWR